MMKKILSLFVLVFVAAAGCATQQGPQQSSSGGYSGGTTYSEAPSYSGKPEAPSADAIEAEPEVPHTPPSSSQYSVLADAVRTESDEKIYQAATQILVQSPTDPRALNALAMYHYKKGRFDLARFLLGKALTAAQGKSSELHSNMGIVQLAQDERREAVQSFRKALDINSDDGVAAANLGAIYVQERDYAKAMVVLDVAYRKGIRDPRVLNNYGIACTAAGKFDQAARAYEDALKKASGNKEILFNYAVLLVEHAKKYQQGLELINRLKFVGGPADTRNRIIALENKAKAGLK